MMKKILATLLCAAMLLTSAVYAEGKVDITNLAMNATADYAIMAEDVIMADDVLQQSSDTLSMSTAWYMLTAFNQMDGAQMKKLVEDLGFTVVKQEYYDKELTDFSHTSAYTMATKEMTVRGENRNVAVIGVRATVDAEWHSNFDFAGETQGACQYAENFMASAQTVFDHVKADLDAMDNPVILVSGYSRGAATANLLGMLLDDTYGMEDVYVYTFATPRTLRCEKEGYDNIFNFVNDNDPVTHMPLEQWGFSRVGVDIVMKDETVNNEKAQAMFDAMLELCPDVDSFYQDRHNLADFGLSDDGMTTIEFVEELADMLINPTGMNLGAKKLMATMMQKKNDFTAFFALFGTMMQNPAAGLLSQHMPQVYAELMNQLN